MMYVNGYAFIFEGDTEKEFYLSLLNHLCNKYDVSLKRVVNNFEPDISYELHSIKGTSIIKFKTVNSITQMPKSGTWFTTQCMKKYNISSSWTVFLCYDTDSPNADVSKFYIDDWEILRQQLENKAKIIDVAAAADIEDVMLDDLESICAFLNCSIPIALKGKKGKLKNLFRDNGLAYHEGKRAKPLIDILDMEKLISINRVELSLIEKIIFN